ncbi:MAG: fatty acid desaturase [Planctomycetales bacterium]|nr:fatty acid desaturase [Planctomycetales bacterium]
MNRRDSKELLIASKRFASEDRWISWWCLSSTILIYATLLAVAASRLSYSLRLPCSILAGLVHVRLFVIFHDVQHGAVLQNSKTAKIVMGVFGLLSLNPPSVWNHSHDHHHLHNSNGFGENVGSYPILTTTEYKALSGTARLRYAMARHPMTMLMGYFTVFLWRMTIRPLINDPIRHRDGLYAVALHVLALCLLTRISLDAMLLGICLPLTIASCIGAYLFYAQHNFPTARLRSGSEWSHVDAALNSSSFIPMGPLMQWLTGNIGFHHVHHLNARIPFYRLPEAMSALVELQTPRVTTLSWIDVRRCLKLKLWDVELDRLVGFDEC